MIRHLPAFAFLFLLALPSLADDARVTRVKGDAWIRASVSSPRGPLAKDSPILEGNVLDVGEGARVTITLPDKSKVELGPESTTVRFDGHRLNTISFTLFRGKMRNEIRPLKGEAAYSVTTPVNVVGVRGTEFQLEVADNGATRTAVEKGRVAVERDEYGTEHGRGEVAEEYLVDPPNDDKNWFARNRISSAEYGAAVESELAARLDRNRELAEEEFAAMASLAARVGDLAARHGGGAGFSLDDGAEIAELFAEGLKLYRRQLVRRQAVDAQHTLAMRLAAEHGVDATASEKAYAEYSSRRRANGGSIDGFISALERLSLLARTASAASKARTPLDLLGGVTLPF